MSRFKPSLPVAILALLMSALLLTACGKDDDQTPAEPEAVSLSAEHSSLLAYAPADSTFLLANLEPVPEDLARYYINKTSPMVQQAVDSFKSTMDMMENSEDGDGEVDPEAEQALSVMQAVVTELDGKYTPEGLQSLGFSLTPRVALYEQDLAPVMRMEISDRAAMEASLNRIAENAGVDIGGQQQGNATYWQFPLGDENLRTVTIDADEIPEDGNVEDLIENLDESETQPANPLLDLFIAITDQQLIASIQPQSLESERLPQLLAAEGKYGEAAAERINSINDEHQLLPYGTTLLDINGLMTKALESNSAGAIAIRDAFGFDPAMLDASCVADVRRMLTNLGDIVSGSTRLDQERMDQYSLIELNGGLAQDFQALTNGLPALNKSGDKDSAMAMRFGINLIALRDWMKGVLDNYEQNPFACEGMQDMNQQMAEARIALNRPLPPFVSNWRGMQLTLDEIPSQGMAGAEGSADMMQNISGMFSLYMENPQMLLGMAQMFVPQLAEIQLQPNGEITQLPQQFDGGDMSMELPPSWAAMTDQLLAVAFGADRRDDLAGVVDSEPVNDGTVMEMEYDYALYAESMGNFTESMMAPEAAENEDAREAMQMQADMLRSYADMFERVGFSMKFTEQGIVFDQQTHIAQ